MSHLLTLSNDVELHKNNVDPCCVRRIAEGFYNDEANLYAYNESPRSHRFASCTVYDDRYFSKVHDSDGYEYLVVNKTSRFLIFITAEFETVGNADGVGLGISNASGVGDYSHYIFNIWYTNGYASPMVTLFPCLHPGHIIKWSTMSNSTRKITNVTMQIFSIE